MVDRVRAAGMGAVQQPDDRRHRRTRLPICVRRGAWRMQLSLCFGPRRLPTSASRLRRRTVRLPLSKSLGSAQLPQEQAMERAEVLVRLSTRAFVLGRPSV